MLMQKVFGRKICEFNFTKFQFYALRVDVHKSKNQNNLGKAINIKPFLLVYIQKFHLIQTKLTAKKMFNYKHT